MQTLNHTLKASMKTLTKLEMYNWFDDYLRVLFVEFNLFNAHSNILSVATLIFEQTPHGVIAPKIEVGLILINP